MIEHQNRTRVIILTRSYQVAGDIFLIRGARLTDYIVESKNFIAVTEVEVKDHTGRLVLKTPFLNLNREHIEIILPAELATFE